MIAKAEFEARAPFKMIETRIWTDEKFVKLSRVKPSGQSLFLYLLSGPHTLQPRMVPGVFRVSRAALAEALDWSIEEFDACFAEISRFRMASADWEHQVLWLPNVLKRAMPRSPSNVVGWRVGWDTLPDCELKRRIHRSIEPTIKGLGDTFARAFDAALRPVAGLSKAQKKVKKGGNQGGASAPRRAIHQRLEGPPMTTDKPRPSEKKSRPISTAKGEPSAAGRVDQISDSREEIKENVKGVNGATAPLPPRARMREGDADHETTEAAPDKAQSEFASVRRFTANIQRDAFQRDLLDDDDGKPLSHKDSGEDGRTIPANMVEPSAPERSKGKSRKASPAKAPGPDTGPTWAAYSEAFFARYGVDAVRNAVVNSQMLHFVERIGEAEAPAVARFYVESCSSAWYVKRCHAVGVLLQDAEALHTQWATRRPVTATDAAMADRTATNANAFGPLIAEARELERREGKHDN
ncbi:hypothetical protein [Burkholderia pseudomallei]|uniref:hypothetical protein n=1 Tax=Burkholderia pseudomallei TaxID=28450 RepID=UPI000A6B88E9|nr:hypothetical protein [Burkholderia pseudomallei]